MLYDSVVDPLRLQNDFPFCASYDPLNYELGERGDPLRLTTDGLRSPDYFNHRLKRELLDRWTPPIGLGLPVDQAMQTYRARQLLQNADKFEQRAQLEHRIGSLNLLESELLRKRRLAVIQGDFNQRYNTSPQLKNCSTVTDLIPTEISMPKL